MIDGGRPARSSRFNPRTISCRRELLLNGRVGSRKVLNPANLSRRVSARFPVGYQGPKEAPGAKIGCLIFALKPANRRLVSTKVSRDFDVIQPVSGLLPDCFLSTLQNFLYSTIICLSHSKTDSSEGRVTEPRRAMKAQSIIFSVLCSAN